MERCFSEDDGLQVFFRCQWTSKLQVQRFSEARSVPIWISSFGENMGKVTDVIKNLTCVILDMPKFKQVFFLVWIYSKRTNNTAEKTRTLKENTFVLVEERSPMLIYFVWSCRKRILNSQAIKKIRKREMTPSVICNLVVVALIFCLYPGFTSFGHD